MKTNKWINIVFWISATATVFVALWWAVVFYFVGQQTGEPLSNFALCLFAPTAECNLLRGMAWLQGINPYEPIAFLWMLSLAVFAWCVKRSQKTQSF